MAGPREDLDDIVQSAAERVLRALPKFEGRSHFTTWTYGIAYHTLLDHDRWFRRWCRRFVFSEDTPAREPRSAFDSEQALIDAERVRRLHQALDALPPAKRAVVLLCEIEGMTAAEVAAIVGTNAATVRSRLRDARLKLAKLLEDQRATETSGMNTPGTDSSGTHTQRTNTAFSERGRDAG